MKKKHLVFKMVSHKISPKQSGIFNFPSVQNKLVIFKAHWK